MVTPTYQYKIHFARAEFSHVAANSTTTGLAFGPGGNNTTQAAAYWKSGFCSEPLAFCQAKGRRPDHQYQLSA
jgi:hypothetical protein